MGNDGLRAAVPVDDIVAKPDLVRRHGPAIIRVASVIRVGPAHEATMLIAAIDVEELAGFGDRKAHDGLDPLPMLWSPGLHEGGCNPGRWSHSGGHGESGALPAYAVSAESEFGCIACRVDWGGGGNPVKPALFHVSDTRPY